MHHGRQRNYRNTIDFDYPHHAFLDRTSSLNSRRSFSNGSAKHSYSSFSRSHRDKDRERDKERSSFVDHWEHDTADPLDSILTSRIEKLGVSTSRVEMVALPRSHSLISRKQGEAVPRRVAVSSGDIGNSKNKNGNDLLPGGTIGSSIDEAMFEKDFPSLGPEERQAVLQIARISSPCLSSVSSPVGNSSLIGGEGWTSALAEMPILAGSSSTGSMSAPLTVSTSGSGGPSATMGLNMAEALVQAPSRTCTAPQLSVKTQRREELAINQSKQLIPVIPSMPKCSVLNSVDKSKVKPAVRASEMNIAVKSGQQQPSLIHHGWESGVSSPKQKDVATPTTNVNSKVTTSQHAVAAVTSAPARNSNNPKHSTRERKAAALNPIAGFTVEKIPSLAQTQSRNDFFNLLKKKMSTNTSSCLSVQTLIFHHPPQRNMKFQRKYAVLHQLRLPMRMILQQLAMVAP
ncbi:cell wall protein AWA1-like isoform X2 [Hibiscus syriacus]|uniref:Cell wall protein AWA1-like isoform X2 n=1 Tax=Hibiscus syriacus TaxID=106335 RepID=A0A6A3C6X4_HIBSY|nr:cell wall protein AWA1-like isoform X2 [Hibiscus syriacus]